MSASVEEINQRLETKITKELGKEIMRVKSPTLEGMTPPQVSLLMEKTLVELIRHCESAKIKESLKNQLKSIRKGLKMMQKGFTQTKGDLYALGMHLCILLWTLEGFKPDEIPVEGYTSQTNQ